MKKTLKITTITITSLLFILAFYIMIFGAIARKNNELLNFFGYSYSFVPTDSMDGDLEDSFRAGSIVISKKVKFTNLNVGDIVIYQDTHSSGVDILIVHRIIEQNPNGSFTTQGDNPNSMPDTIEVTNDIYQAKVIKTFKMFNFGSKVGSYQLQLLFLLIILLVGFSIYQIFNIIKTFKNEKLEQLKDNNKTDIEELRKEILKEIEEENKKED